MNVFPRVACGSQQLLYCMHNENEVFVVGLMADAMTHLNH